MAESSKLEMESETMTCSRGIEEMGTQKISVASDMPNGFHYKSEKNDSFVVDIESITHTDNTTPKSRITRKGLHRGSSPTANERDNNNSILSAATSSPRGYGAPGTPVATPDIPGSPQVHHQITVTASNMNASPMPDSKWNARRSYSFRRPAPSWAIDPRKILFFFATLSSMGTMLLIYLTLATSKLNADSDDQGWWQ